MSQRYERRGEQAREHDRKDFGSLAVELDRRRFVYAGLVVLGLAVLGGAVKSLSADARLLRPPGAANLDRFVSLCTRCDRCRSVCPTEAIAPATLEDGLLAVRTPKLDFKLGWCNFCGRCAAVCPTGALPTYAGERFSFSGLPDVEFYRTDLLLGLAVVDRERCIAWAGPSTCNICSQNCPYGAISPDAYGRPVVDDGLCNGCGVCENLCPSSKLQSYRGGQARGIEVEPMNGSDDNGSATS